MAVRHGQTIVSSEPDPEIDIELDRDIAAELSLVPRDRLAGTLPLALLVVLLRLWPECIAWAGDVVLHAITRGQPHTVLPHLTGPQPVGALAEGVPDPCAGCTQLALDELIADRGVFAHGLTERLCQPITFSTHLGHVAQLARHLTAQCALRRRSAATLSGWEALVEGRRPCGRLAWNGTSAAARYRCANLRRGLPRDV